MAERALVDIVVPVHNEEAVLSESVHRLHSYLSDEFPLDWRIVIADNASTDRTPIVARDLAAELAGVEVMRLEEKGRGRALRTAWMKSNADAVAYTDVDLSTGLTGFLPLVAPLLTGHSDLSVGSRLSEGSVVARGPKRELISRIYNLILRVVFAVRFRDAQCGFKAIRTDIAHRLLPAVEDEE
jgi:glycosyltransferase involved in cell wall biosynthesis